ncbi:MAG: glycosyltransferase, partial [candidate division WOR-3 bacterium]|nr:glycosyltransferase [candidate division WOR-3 bacterium]
MNELVSIIVPAYNEEENIPLLVDAVDGMMKESNLHCELIIVDDGSEDETYIKAVGAQKNQNFIKVTRHKRRMGVTEALLSGFKMAEGDIFVYFPADLQYASEDISKMVEKIQGGYDIVCGWKVGRYNKRFVSNIYNALSRKLFHIPVHDLNSIKAFKREIVNEIPWRKDWHRYMVVMAYEQGFNVGEVRVNLYPRRYGKSKFGGPGRAIVGILDLIAVKFQVSFMRKPMLFFGSIGGILLLAALIVGIIALYMRFGLERGYRPLIYLVIFLGLGGL